MTLHASTRIFWGLTGRKEIHEFDTTTNTNIVREEFSSTLANSKDYPYLGIHNKPMFKVNIGTVIGDPNSKFKVSFHVYNLLGGNGSKANINSLRWMEEFDINSTDLFGMDYRSFALKVNYIF